MTRQRCYMLSRAVVPAPEVTGLLSPVSLLRCRCVFRLNCALHVKHVDLLVFAAGDEQ